MIRLKKDIEIQAIQFVNTPERIEEIRKMFDKNEIEVIYNKNGNIKLEFFIDRNLLYINENNWIVKYPYIKLNKYLSGYEYVTMSDEEFKEYFEIV